MTSPVTSPVTSAASVPADRFAAGRPWRLHPSVGLRPEPFGALAYHFGTRRLTFLKDPVLTELVRGLGEHADLQSALDAVGIPAGRRGAMTAALARLADAEVICERGVTP